MWHIKYIIPSLSLCSYLLPSFYPIFAHIGLWSPTKNTKIAHKSILNHVNFPAISGYPIFALYFQPNHTPY
jgi:hypothetical protein